MDVKAVADGDTVTVYVSTMDPRESSSVPKEVQVAAAQRAKARAKRNYPEADALHKKITDMGYRLGTCFITQVMCKHSIFFLIFTFILPIPIALGCCQSITRKF